MAWVNRTTRDNCAGGLPTKSNTSAQLGPGYYETSSTRQVRPNAAGFGSGEKLERGANAGSTKGLTMITPGPGTYVTNNQTPWESPTKSKASATSIFQSKSQRLGEVKLRRGHSTPGPGAYSKGDPFAPKSKTHTSLGNPLVRTPPSDNKIRWTRLPTAPSIPTVSQSFGYEQGAYGKLVRHEPAKVGHTGVGSDTLGPGEYEPMKGLKNISKTRTTDFSKGKVTRYMDNEVRSRADVPGPGEYTNGDANIKDAARTSAVFKSALSREQAGQSTVTKNMPGPGTYHPNQTHGFAKETKPEHLQFFGSTSTRFEGSQRDGLVPGPGSYYCPPSGVVLQPRSLPHKKKAPFSSKKERFESLKEKDQSLAAPGSYEVPSAVSEVLNKVTSRVSNFGSTTKRFDTISSGTSSVRESLESQFEQDMKAQEMDRENQGRMNKKRQQVKASSMFASSTSRPHQIQKATGPSPGDYETQRSWEAAGARGAFQSGIDRMKDRPKQSVPGPGAYSTERVNQKPLHMARPNVFYAAEPRFKEKLSKVPVLGPGQYNTDTVELDWNRPTHNISIATEMEMAMLQ
ncbi:Sperm-tail PG-rich repeat-containing protein 2 [Phytophthora boehmeriae]|uniref:Sperm-tail PG-rich repeat-containing protein 2 n=1 Tax=Phytophthora boehmeriae TaxID=109152 RepID=A0A8T1WCX9_9STRA|nr:Sperm-tail PG-rich repeat-containing protein 2 [Phytophthora boehmeriae]